MESEDVESVRDFRIGERPRSVKLMRSADFNVLRRECARGGGGRGGGSMERLESTEEADVLCAWRGMEGRAERFEALICGVLVVRDIVG